MDSYRHLLSMLFLLHLILDCTNGEEVLGLQSEQQIVDVVADIRKLFLSNCDAGIYHTRKYKKIAGKIAKKMEVPVLFLTENFVINDTKRIYTSYANRYRKNMNTTEPDYWCFAWIIVAADADEAAGVLQKIRSNVRYWTLGAYVKRIIYLPEQEVGDAILQNPMLNTQYQANTVYILKTPTKKRKSVKVYQFLPFSSSQSKPFFREVEYYSGLTENHNIPLFPEIFYNLHKTEITVMGLNWSSISRIKKNDDGSYMFLESLTLKYLTYLSNKLNFVLKAYFPDDKLFGALQPDGSWNGMVGSLITDKADMVNGLSITPIRSKYIDFSYPFDFDSLTFCTSLPKPLPQWLALFRPFSGIYIWLAVAFSVPLIGLVLFGLTKVFSYIAGNNGQDVSPLNEFILLSFRSIIGNQDDYASESKAIMGMLLLTAFYSLLITNFYKTSLIAHLQQPSFTKNPGNLEELIKSDLTWGIVGNGAADYEFFKSADEEIYKKVFKKLQFCESIPSCMQRAVDTNFAYIGYRFVQEDVGASNFVNKKGKSLITIAKQSFNVPLSQGVGFQPGAYIQPAINRAIFLLEAAGLFERLVKILLEKSALEGRKSSTVEDEDVTEILPLSLYHLQPAFYILILGVVVSLLVFIGEIAITKSGGKQTNTM